MTVRVAVDAMGGDRAPGEIVAGAREAAATLDVEILLVGRPEAIGDAGGLEVVPASEVIAMDEDPAVGVRRKKDASLVRCAELVRDGKADAMLSAGNTGAAMAAALLRMGRLRGVARPAIATPIPVPDSTPTVLIDAGANAECTPQYLVQFAQMGSVFAAARYGIASPRVGLLSIGEEPSKGTPLVKEAHKALRAAGVNFVGNVEGRDVMTDAVDVVVTDGFTGNVVLKTLEGGLRALVRAVVAAVGHLPEAVEALVPLAQHFDPDNTGGAMLLGVDGVCIISHGSSSARAVVNAVRVAADMVGSGVVAALHDAVA